MNNLQYALSMHINIIGELLLAQQKMLSMYAANQTCRINGQPPKYNERDFQAVGREINKILEIARRPPPKEKHD